MGAKNKSNQTHEGECWCGSGDLFTVCCEPLLNGSQHALSAQALMQSRYCAYVLQDESYLRATWALETCPDDLHVDPRQRWLGLKVLAVRDGQAGDDVGIVEFVARFKINGGGHRLHEVSRFQRRGEKWVYVDGDVLPK